MKKSFYSFNVFSVILFLTALTSCSDKIIIFQNSLDTERRDELVFLKREFLEKRLGNIPDGKVLSIGSDTPVQLIDFDNDGKWDEAAVLLSFATNERKECSVSVASDTKHPGAVRAHVRHRRNIGGGTFGPLLSRDSIPAGQAATDFSKTSLPPFLTEGPAWENDKVGFRIYFDIRNGKDIWGKTTEKMMMDTVGVVPSENYHQQAPWGMDVLKVGASLGAGSLALSVPVGEKDTLVRLGGTNMGKVLFEKVADGPLVAICRLTYPEWKVFPNSSPVTLVEEIKIWGGKYFYESNVSVENAPAGSRLVTGIVNLKSKSSTVLKEEQATAVYTFDKQSENSDELGMALTVLNNNYLASSATSDTTGEIRNTYTLVTRKLHDSSFRFYAGWSPSDSAFSSENSFAGFLKKELKSYSKPVDIHWK